VPSCQEQQLSSQALGLLVPSQLVRQELLLLVQQVPWPQALPELSLQGL
jgi:hypothetical protein